MLEVNVAKIKLNLEILRAAVDVAQLADPTQTGAEHFYMAVATFVGGLMGKMTPKASAAFLLVITETEAEMRKQDAGKDAQAQSIADDLMRIARGG